MVFVPHDGDMNAIASVSPDRSPMPLLIVEDVPTMRRLYRHYLEQEYPQRFHYLEAATLAEGLTLWRSHAPALVLLDFRLPDGDGLAFLQAILAGGTPSPLPVIVMTGHGNEQIAVQAMKLGAADYLIKGEITATTLGLAVHQVFERISLSQQLARAQSQEQFIAQIALEIHQSLQLPEILTTVVEALQGYLNTDRVLVYQFAEQQVGKMVAEARREPWASCLHREWSDACFSHPQSLLGVQKAISVITDRQMAPIADCHRQMLAQWQVQAHVVLPIYLPQTDNPPQLWGLLLVHQCEAPRPWRSEEIQLLQRLSVQLAIAIHKAELYQSLQALNLSLEQKVSERTRALQSLIQEREEAFQLLQKSEQRYMTLAELAPVGIFRANLRGECIYANERCDQIAGVSLENLMGWEWLRGVHPEDRDRVLHHWQQAIRHHHLYQLEYRFVSGNGQITWVYAQAVAERTLQGEVVGYVGTLTDISDRKHVEEQLQTFNQILETTVAERTQALAHTNLFQQAILNGATYAIISTDTQGLIQSFNAGAEKMLGYTAEEVIGRHSPDLFFLPPESLSPETPLTTDRTQPPHFLLLATSSPPTIAQAREWTCLRRDGNPVPVSLTITALRDENQTPIGFLCIAQDISERRQMEDRLQASQRKFQRLVEEIGDKFIMFSHSGLEGIITYVSGGIDAVFGIERDQAIGHCWMDVVPWSPQSVERAQAYVQALTNHEAEFQQFEMEFLSPDGTKHRLRIAQHPIYHAGGDLMAVEGLIEDITEQIWIENERQKLIQELSAFKLALDQSAIVAITNTQGIITYVNEHFCHISGYDPEELIGQSHRLINSGTHPPKFFKKLWQTIARGEVWRGEICNRKKNGDLYWVDTAIVPFVDDKGVPFQYLAIRFDITASKNVEACLLEYSREIEDLYNQAPCGYHSLDEHGCYININNTELAWLGYRREEILGRHITELLTEDSIPIFFNRFPLFIHDGYVKDLRLNFRRADGTVLPTILNSSAVYDHEKNYLYSRTTIFDVTDLQEAEHALQQSNELLRIMSKAQSQFITAGNRLEIFDDLLTSLLELTASEYGFIGEVFYQGDGSITLEENFLKIRGVPRLKTHAITNLAWNEETQALYEQGQMMGMEFTNMNTLFGAVIMTGQPVIANTPSTDPRRGGTPEGHPPLLAFLGLPFFSHNQLVGMVGIANRPGGYDEAIVDYLQPFLVTCGNLIQGYRLDRRRRQAEADLQQSNEELARATRLKDEFLANMSHELRTPLNAILGMTEGLQEKIFGPLNEQQHQALSTVERSGNHLLELINDVLDVAKIEAGQVDLHCEAVAVKLLCQSSLTFIKQQAFKKNIAVESKIPDTLPKLWGDERRLRQILLNLLNNAVKFTPEGGKVTLEVQEIKQLSEQGDPLPSQIQIAIHDTGIGIAPEHLEQLFQPFIQIDSALNRQYMGTGLGLALVKRLVKLHGGEVEVTSMLKVGSCFTVKLPCLEAIAHPSPRKQESPDPEHPLDTEVQPPLLLLIEDSEANINTLSSYLGAKGYRLVVARNSRESMALTVSAPLDLILINLNMSEMDSVEAIQTLRAEQQCTVPILALAAFPIEEDEARCLKAGANAYLAKPFKLKQLLTLIQKQLSINSAII